MKLVKLSESISKGSISTKGSMLKTEPIIATDITHTQLSTLRSKGKVDKEDYYFSDIEDDWTEFAIETQDEVVDRLTTVKSNYNSTDIESDIKYVKSLDSSTLFITILSDEAYKRPSAMAILRKIIKYLNDDTVSNSNIHK